jgi:hypothetical protein
VTSDRIAREYLRRVRTRRLALDTFLAAGLHGDVMRQAQEITELVLKGARQVVDELEKTLTRLADERGRAFYGDETRGIPSSDLYGPDDARQAVAIADRLIAMYERLLAEA